MSLLTGATDATANCSSVQLDDRRAAHSAIPWDCDPLLGFFEVCSDECLAAYKTFAGVAPDCMYEGYNSSLLAIATSDVAACEKERADTANKYTPVAYTDGGIRNCTSDDYALSARNHRSFGECFITLRANDTCPDDCLTLIETSIPMEPLCLDNDKYLLGEYEKIRLVECLRARGDQLKDNTVLQTVVGGTNSTSKTSTTTPPSATTSTPSSSAASTAGIARSTALVLCTAVAAMVSACSV